MISWLPLQIAWTHGTTRIWKPRSYDFRSNRFVSTSFCLIKFQKGGQLRLVFILITWRPFNWTDPYISFTLPMQPLEVSRRFSILLPQSSPWAQASCSSRFIWPWCFCQLGHRECIPHGFWNESLEAAAGLIHWRSGQKSHRCLHRAAGLRLWITWLIWDSFMMFYGYGNPNAMIHTFHNLYIIYHESELLWAQLKFSFTNSVSFISILSLLILYQ